MQYCKFLVKVDLSIHVSDSRVEGATVYLLMLASVAPNRRAHLLPFVKTLPLTVRLRDRCGEEGG